MTLSQPVYGRIVNYRIGIKAQMGKWCLIQFGDADSIFRMGQIIGRKVVLKYGKNRFIGKVMSFHGKNGVVEAHFRKGVPGQALGSMVELIN
jgi:ribosomal protein L35AE/L33A